VSYTNELVDNIINVEKWPEPPEVIGKLLNIAEGEYEKGTIEGYITSVILYHQITEESVKVLIRYSELVQKAQMWPLILDFKFDEDRLMFGQVLNELKRGIDFSGKEEFIARCYELNKLRIKIVHKIVHIPLSELEKEAKHVKIIFKKILKAFTEGIEFLVGWLSDLRTSIDWEEFLEHEIEDK
jgi:hypothetical protein